MSRRRWKHIRPTSIPHAMELCLDYARSAKNRSVDQVADRMGLANKWSIYKWVESGRIPAILIRPFELACGIDYVSRYIALSGHQLLVDIPVGRTPDAADVNELQVAMTECVAHLLAFAQGREAQPRTLAAIERVMGGLAWHRANVETYDTPQFDFAQEQEEGGA